MEPELNTRIRYIDVAKGIGILLVVLGHLMIPGQWLKDCIYACHMPLFLVLSGYFEKGNTDYMARYAKLFKRLYIPFFCCIIIEAACTFVSYGVIGNEGMKLQRVAYWILLLSKVSFKALVGNSYLYNLPIWFLFSLFVVKIVYTILAQIRNTDVRYAIIISIMAVAFAYMCMFKDLGVYNRHLPAYAILPSFFFYSVGFFFKKAIKTPDTILKNHDRKHSRQLLCLTIVSALLLPVLVRYNGYTEIYGCQFRRPPLLVFNGLLGAFVIISISAYISRLHALAGLYLFFSFWGRNSIKVLVTHYLLTDHLFIWIYDESDILDLMITPLHETCLFIITVVIEYAVVICANRWLTRGRPSCSSHNCD